MINLIYKFIRSDLFFKSFKQIKKERMLILINYILKIISVRNILIVGL